MKHLFLFTLCFCSLFLLSCSKKAPPSLLCDSAQDLECFLIEKGEHAAHPTLIAGIQAIEVTSQKWEVVFGEGTNYDLANIDQADYNKLCGRTFDLLDRNYEAAMIGWRYNSMNGMIELVGFFNQEDEHYIIGPIMEVAQCEVFEVQLSIDFDAKIYSWVITKEDGSFQQYSFQFQHDLRASYEVNVYFGGNQRAPQDMQIYKREP